jgi:hypothetical protein
MDETLQIDYVLEIRVGENSGLLSELTGCIPSQSFTGHLSFTVFSSKTIKSCMSRHAGLYFHLL